MSNRRADAEQSGHPSSSTAARDAAPPDREVTRRQMLRRAGLVAAAPGVMGLLQACGSTAAAPSKASGGSPKRGGTMQIATDQMFEGDSLDPLLNINDGQGIAQGLLRECLSALDVNQAASPLLASWVANSNFTQYELTLRRGVTFHNGKPLTATDVAWNLDRNVNPKLGSNLLARLSGSIDPSGIEVVDAQHLKLKLLRSDSGLMSPLGRLFLCPAGTTDFNKGVGTGPFTLESWVPGVSCRTVRNPHYWRSDLPYLDGVDMFQISETSTKTESVMSGPSDVTEIDYQSVPLVSGAERSGTVQLLKGHEFSLLNVAMNMTARPYSDNRVREALKRSVDRQALIRTAYAGYGSVAADAPAPIDDPQFPSSLKPRTEQDLALAHKLMTAAGYPNGLQITLPCSNDSLHATFALAFAQAVTGSPFTISVQQHPGDTYWNKIYLNVPIFVSDWNRRTAVDSTSAMLYGSSDEVHWNNPQASALLNRALASTGSEQDAAVGQMLTIISETSGEIIPAYRDRLFMAKASVRNLGLNVTSLYSFTSAYRA